MGETPPTTPESTPGKPLTAGEQRIADAYIEVGPVDGRMTATAKKLGLKGKHSAGDVGKALKRPHVAAYVRAREEAITAALVEKQVLNKEFIINSLLEVHKQCMKGEPVLEYDPVEKAMVPTGEWQFDSKGANRALELLGKEIGMFEKKPQLDDRKIFNVQINLNKYHDEHGNVVEHEPAKLPFQGGINGKTTG